jgi:TetR/AcrR family transcriptional regulator, ethionamide resistance regulator
VTEHLERIDRLDRRSRQRGDERRSALLESLDHFLHEGSLESINIADISRRAGVTRSAFYFYFENKAYAVAALMGEMYDEAFTITEHLVTDDDSPARRIEAVIRGLFGALDRHQHVYRAMLEARATNEHVRALWDADRRSFVEPIAGMIRAERETGRAPGGPMPETLASVLLDLNDQAMQRESLRDDATPFAREEHVDALVTIWLRSIYGTDTPGDPR